MSVLRYCCLLLLISETWCQMRELAWLPFMLIGIWKEGVDSRLSSHTSLVWHGRIVLLLFPNRPLSARTLTPLYLLSFLLLSTLCLIPLFLSLPLSITL